MIGKIKIGSTLAKYHGRRVVADRK
jgi:hypothetical protein